MHACNWAQLHTCSLGANIGQLPAFVTDMITTADKLWTAIEKINFTRGWCVTFSLFTYFQPQNWAWRWLKRIITLVEGVLTALITFITEFYRWFITPTSIFSHVAGGVLCGRTMKRLSSIARHSGSRWLSDVAAAVASPKTAFKVVVKGATNLLFEKIYRTPTRFLLCSTLAWQHAR